MKVRFVQRGIVFRSVRDCLLQNVRVPSTQGTSMFLWHRKNKNKDHLDRWEIYKRNKYDMSHDGDSRGYSRWISALPKAPEMEFKRI